MYHRHICATKTFTVIDHALVELLRKWAKRRHAHRKGTLWQKRKYFRMVKNRDWVFTAKDEEGNDVDLFQATSVKIKRWPRIKAAANPFDPEWEVYFERRQQEKWPKSLPGEIFWRTFTADKRASARTAARPPNNCTGIVRSI